MKSSPDFFCLVLRGIRADVLDYILVLRWEFFVLNINSSACAKVNKRQEQKCIKIKSYVLEVMDIA